jgi:membrane protein DedA with SNARE-associated domain
VRLALVLKSCLVLAIALRLHHHFHGPPIDYAGLAAAAAASWIGVPGPGEPVLIAAGVFAAHHQLDIATVVVVAWLGATGGGIAGWLIGMKLGRKVLTARGPLWRMRLKALERGDDVFSRYAVLAILLTPSWIAGIHRVPARVYLITNAAGAALWATGIGLGAYYVGPAVIELVQDLGWVTAIGLGLLLAVALAAEIRRRRIRRLRAAQAAPPAR